MSDTLLTLTAFESLYCFRFRPRPFLFERDHKFPTGNENLPVIILYAEIGTREFAEFHRVLSKKSKNGKILYVLRHYIKVHALCCYWFVCFTNISNLCYALFFWPRLKVCRFYSSSVWKPFGFEVALGLIFLLERGAFCSSVCSSCLYLH